MKNKKSNITSGIAKFAAVAALLVAVAVPVAEGSPSGTIQRITALEKKVKSIQAGLGNLDAQLRAAKADVDALKASTGSLQTDVGSLKQGMDCVRYKVVGVASYGQPSSGAGYIWARGSDLFLTTALDVAPAGEQQAWLAVVNPQCVSASSALHLDAHRATLQP